MLHPSRQRGAAAELLVAYRFLEAGRLIAWPLVPCPYDLIVDAGDRLYRVQIKQACECQEDGHLGNWRVRLTKRRDKGDVPVPVNALDLLAVVCKPDLVYVIPAAACASPVDPRYLNARIEIGPESRYQPFRNGFVVGSGQSEEVAPLTPLRRLSVAARHALGGTMARGRRKAHHRLTTAEVSQLEQLPIRWYANQAGENLIPVKEIAQQFDVSVVTLRNLLVHRKRQDLS